LRRLKGSVDFNLWKEPDELIISKSDTSIIINTSYFKIMIEDSHQNDSGYIYDKGNNLLICYRGRILKNPDELIDSYLRKEKDFLTDTNGFYSLILIDIKKREVLLSSDPPGLFRLYYNIEKEILKFSTNVSDLTASDEFCKEGLIQYLLINYLVDENTLFNNVKRVLPGSISIFTKQGISAYKYFDLLKFLFQASNPEKNSPLEDVVFALRNVVTAYIDKNEIISTLTSGYDSRLLLAALIANKTDIRTFTFGVRDNFESKIAQQVTRHFKNIEHTLIELNGEFEVFLETYFNYIKTSKNIELNFSRYHYVYVWNKLQQNFSAGSILTGICGDAFLRIVTSASNQTNEFLHSMIDSKNKKETVNEYLSQKKQLLNRFDLNIQESAEYLLSLFGQFKEDDPYFNHFYYKINFGVINYFGVELNTENDFYPTYPVFLDKSYLEVLVKSGLSAFNKKLFYNRNKLKLASHTYYYKLIKILCNDLNLFDTNRGFPLKYSASLFYLPYRLYLYNKFKKKGYKTDLDYQKWRGLIKIDTYNNLSLDDSLKIKALLSL
jgi:hypothetical protein